MLLKKDAVNDYHGCLEVLETLNMLIDGLYELDNGVLHDDPFNMSSTVDDALTALGMAKTFLADTAEQLALLRSILCCEALDWGQLILSEKEQAQAKERR
jgi:hypothetical protein